MKAERHLDVLAQNLKALLEEPDRDENWFVNLVIAGEQLRGATSMSLETPAPATAALLEDYERTVRETRELLTPGVGEGILAAAEALCAHAQLPPWERDQERGETLLLQLGDAMRFATGLRRAELMDEEVFLRLAETVRRKVERAKGGLFELLESAADQMNAFGADCEFPEGQQWLEELAEDAPSNLRALTALHDPEAVRAVAIRRAMKRFREAGATGMPQDGSRAEMPSVGPEAAGGRKVVPIRRRPSVSTGLEYLGLSRMAAADPESRPGKPKVWPMPQLGLTVRMTTGARTSEGKPGYVVQVDFDEAPVRTPRLVWVAGRRRYPLERTGPDGTYRFKVVVPVETLREPCRLMLGRRRLSFVSRGGERE